MKYLFTTILSAIIFCTGCAITPKPPAVHDFGIVRTSDTIRSAAKTDITVDAPKWLQDNRIHYRLLYAAPTQVRFYTMDRWIAPPAELLKQHLEMTVKSPDFVVVIKLLDFEQQFNAPSQAKVLIRFTVKAYAINQKQKISSQEFSLERITRTPDAIGAVTAFSELTPQIADRIQSWLSGLSEP